MEIVRTGAAALLTLATIVVVAAAPAPAQVPAPIPIPVPSKPTQTRPTIATALASLPIVSAVADAIRQAGLLPGLAEPVAVTLFAPSNEAWSRIPSATRTALLLPANRTALVTLLRQHMVYGAITAELLRVRIAAGGGTATLPTLAGDTLTLTSTEGALTLTDARGNRSYVELADLAQANGVIHVVNGVLVPPMR